MYVSSDVTGSGHKPEKPHTSTAKLVPWYRAYFDYQFGLQSVLVYMTMASVVAGPTIMIRIGSAFIPR